jgi:hypothetical protein
MRRLLTVAVVTGLALSVAAPPAKAKGEGFPGDALSASWRSRRPLTSHTYLRVFWYVDAYDTGDTFWSYLSRYVVRCEEREGRDRCRTKSWQGGWIKRIGAGEFSVDRKLTSGHLEATYRLRTWRDREWHFVGKASIVADLTGVGDVTRSRYSYSFHTGCTQVTYKGRSLSRDAVAVGTLELDGQTRHLGETRHGSLSRGKSLVVENDC